MTEAPKIIDDVRRFHANFGLSYDGSPRTLDPALQSFRENFINEEHAELVSGLEAEKLFMNMASNVTENAVDIYRKLAHDAAACQLDAICDLIYVLVGYALLRGWDIDEAWHRVQAVNMAKETPMPSDPRARSPWDVVKPANFVPPNMDDLV